VGRFKRRVLSARVEWSLATLQMNFHQWKVFWKLFAISMSPKLKSQIWSSSNDLSKSRTSQLIKPYCREITSLLNQIFNVFAIITLSEGRADKIWGPQENKARSLPIKYLSLSPRSSVSMNSFLYLSPFSLMFQRVN
jgi:hypothetical protein